MLKNIVYWAILVFVKYFLFTIYSKLIKDEQMYWARGLDVMSGVGENRMYCSNPKLLQFKMTKEHKLITEI